MCGSFPQSEKIDKKQKSDRHIHPGTGAQQDSWRYFGRGPLSASGQRSARQIQKPLIVGPIAADDENKQPLP